MRALAFKSLKVATSVLVLWGVMAAPQLAFAGAPASQYAPIDSKSGVVVDRKTRLMWERTPQTNIRTFSDAQNYCARLQLNGVGGWRLPTLHELLSLVDPRAANPAIDRTAFPSVSFSEPYWTATGYQDKTRCPNCTWMVDFAGGGADPYNPSVKQGRVRCVRSN